MNNDNPSNELPDALIDAHLGLAYTSSGLNGMTGESWDRIVARRFFALGMATAAGIIDRPPAPGSADNEVQKPNKDHSSGASGKAATVPAGYALVPIDPTDEMLRAAADNQGAWCEPCESVYECGVIVEQGMTQEDCEDINAEILASYADTYRAMLAASIPPEQTGPSDALEIALDALGEIALAGMGLPMAAGGDEDGEQARRFHADQAWRFIRIAANAREQARAAMQGEKNG